MATESSALQEHETLDDVSLLQRYVEAGDQDALGALFRKHSDVAYRTALRVLRDPGDAEDAVQAAFLYITQHASGYRGGAGVRVWMMKIVANVSKNIIKKAVRRRRREASGGEGPDESDRGIWLGCIRHHRPPCDPKKQNISGTNQGSATAMKCK